MANISFRDFSFQLSCFVSVFVFCVDSVFNSFSFLLSWIFIFSHFFRMSKLPESDWERQKGNLQQQNTVCDNGPKGWYRFEGAVGTRMPTSCSPTHRCNSHLPGWLSGAHPTQADGQVTRTVFFHWHSDCCYKSITVKVINCGGYYVYHVNGTPWCHLRFWNRLNRCWSEKWWRTVWLTDLYQLYIKPERFSVKV